MSQNAMKISRTVTLSIVMIVGVVFLISLQITEKQKISRPLSEFPMSIGEWTGKPDKFESWVYEKTGVDDSLLSNFKDSQGNFVQLYIGYYESQRKGDIIHSPRNCMVADGWNIVDSELIEIISQRSAKSPQKVVLLTLQNGVQKQLVLYWYYSRGRVITSEYFQKAYLVLDAVTRQRTDGSFIRLISPVTNDEKKTLRSLKQFAIELVPIIETYLPS